MEIKINITTEHTGTGAGDERFRLEVIKRIAEVLETEFGCGCSQVRDSEEFREDFMTSQCEFGHREDDYEGPQVIHIAASRSV